MGIGMVKGWCSPQKVNPSLEPGGVEGQGRNCCLSYENSQAVRKEAEKWCANPLDQLPGQAQCVPNRKLLTNMCVMVV